MTHTVVVVEDEFELREMMREALEMNGYAVVTAEEGREALEKIAHIEHVCLVFLDLLMPGMNGWDFFMHMRKRPELAAVPVVVHSSVAGRAPVGVTHAFRKPVMLDRLLSVVEEYCKKN